MAPLPAAATSKETVDNPYGLGALWAQGDFVSRGTLILLVIMSMGSWYILVTKLYEKYFTVVATYEVTSTAGAVAGKVALQGNLDPAVMRASPDVIRRQARAVMDSFGNHPGHVFNLGHGITPEVDPTHMQVLVDEVHAYGRVLRRR